MKLLLVLAIASVFALSYADLMSDSLAAHHKYRSPLGIQDLEWSSSLARSAQRWADYLARNKQFAHSPNRDNIGENIAYGSSHDNDAERLVDLWAEESEFFVAGENYPECSSTGDQADVWHYTQMIWEETTEVGCGMGYSSGKIVYVCQYHPAGNAQGEPVYTVSGEPEETVSEEPEEPVSEEPEQPEEPVSEEPEEPVSEEPEQPEEQPEQPEEEVQPEQNSEDSFISESLAAHHYWRSAVGVPDLVWNNTLAKNAKIWADNIAKAGRSSHSKNRVNTGENISWGSANTDGNDIEGFVGLWGAEGDYFVAGRPYPKCTSGGESDVWHYTQLVWKKTTQVGCGMGEYNKRLFYVCQYYPRGNMIGQEVF